MLKRSSINVQYLSEFRKPLDLCLPNAIARCGSQRSELLASTGRPRGASCTGGKLVCRHWLVDSLAGLISPQSADIVLYSAGTSDFLDLTVPVMVTFRTRYCDNGLRFNCVTHGVMCSMGRTSGFVTGPRFLWGLRIPSLHC